MKNLIQFDNLIHKIKSNFICEDTAQFEADPETNIEIDASATVNGQQVPVTVNASEDINIDNVNIDKIDINVNIQNLKVKLQHLLDQTKKKAYASRLYSTKVGNNPDALRDYGYFLGQKDILYSVLKDLNTICTNIQEQNDNE